MQDSTASGSYSTGAIYTYSKSLSEVGQDYAYYFEAKSASNEQVTGIPTNPVAAPDVFSSIPNTTNLEGLVVYNNLFDPANNEKVYVRYDLVKEAEVKIVVYNIKWQKIKELFVGRKDAGVYTDLSWDGKNSFRTIIFISMMNSVIYARKRVGSALVSLGI